MGPIEPAGQAYMALKQAKQAAQWGNPPPGRVQTLADLGIGQDVPLIPETLGALQERSFALIDEARASFDALEKRLVAVLRPARVSGEAGAQRPDETPAVIKTQQELISRLSYELRKVRADMMAEHFSRSKACLTALN